MWIPSKTPLSDSERKHLEEVIEYEKEYICNLRSLRDMGVIVDPYKIELKQNHLNKLYKILEGFEWRESRDNTFIMI